MPSARFACGIRSTAVGSLGEPMAHIWNPHASISLFVVQTCVFGVTDTFESLLIIRISNRGTSGIVVTPDIDNHFDRRFAPISGALLEAGDYTVNPTQLLEPLGRLRRGDAQIGDGAALQWDGKIEVPSLTGLALYASSGTTPAQAEVTFVWDE